MPQSTRCGVPGRRWPGPGCACDSLRNPGGRRLIEGVLAGEAQPRSCSLQGAGARGMFMNGSRRHMQFLESRSCWRVCRSRVCQAKRRADNPEAPSSRPRSRSPSHGHSWPIAFPPGIDECRGGRPSSKRVKDSFVVGGGEGMAYWCCAVRRGGNSGRIRCLSREPAEAWAGRSACSRPTSFSVFKNETQPRRILKAEN